MGLSPIINEWLQHSIILLEILSMFQTSWPIRLYSRGVPVGLAWGWGLKSERRRSYFSNYFLIKSRTSLIFRNKWKNPTHLWISAKNDRNWFNWKIKIRRNRLQLHLLNIFIRWWRNRVCFFLHSIFLTLVLVVGTLLSNNFRFLCSFPQNIRIIIKADHTSTIVKPVFICRRL